MGGNRLPQKLDLKRTRSLAGIIYSFVGAPLGEARDFATLYREEQISKIEPVLHNVFETCFSSCREQALPKDFFDFTSHYLDHLHLKQAKLDEALNLTLGSKRNVSFRSIDGGDKLELISDQAVLVNPVRFLRSRPLFGRTYICTVHGDLNGWNILVDRHNETWLIDFALTGQGHILQDFASLESFVKFSMLTVSDLSVLYQWENSLLVCSDFGRPAELVNVPASQELVKAHKAISKIRELAYHAKGEPDMKEYSCALLFNALKTLTRLSSPRSRREHALISAGLLCERLAGDAG